VTPALGNYVTVHRTEVVCGFCEQDLRRLSRSGVLRGRIGQVLSEQERGAGALEALIGQA
jgi:hypothetical protein